MHDFESNYLLLSLLDVISSNLKANKDKFSRKTGQLAGKMLTRKFIDPIKKNEMKFLFSKYFSSIDNPIPLFQQLEEELSSVCEKKASFQVCCS